MDSLETKKQGGWRRKLVIFSFLIFIAISLIPQGMKELGRWLVVQDSLDKADAIVVLSGHLPYRAMEGAFLFRAGWGPEVWLTSGMVGEDERIMARLGVQCPREETYSRAVLERLSVPPGVIYTFPEGAQNTVEEVRLIATRMKSRGEERVIIVTSKAHSRRVRATWKTLIGDSPRATVRYAREDPFHSDHWWNYTEDGLSVVREVVGNLNVWAGFPIKPKAR